MNILQGFTLEEPKTIIKWGISENDLINLYPNKIEKHNGVYYTTGCTSLMGLKHNLSIHFQPQNNGRLAEFRFTPDTEMSFESSYNIFQKHFELVFGEPTKSRIDSTGFKYHEWKISDILIWHCIIDRFGLEEQMIINGNDI